MAGWWWCKTESTDRRLLQNRFEPQHAIGERWLRLALDTHLRPHTLRQRLNKTLLCLNQIWVWEHTTLLLLLGKIDLSRLYLRCLARDHQLVHRTLARLCASF